MRSLCLLVAVAAAAHAAHPIRQDMLDHIAQAQNGSSYQTYKLDENPFALLSEDEIVGMMGLRDYRPISSTSNVVVGDIPSSFDARQKWSDCIHPIRDQAKCCSCW